MRHVRRLLISFVALLAATGGTQIAATSAGAEGVSGAIFTTVADGSEVNFNIYPSKEAVYLDGGPGIGAPQHAAGLPDGTYVFQVTDPSGKVLLSSDAARCRQVTVTGGIITGVVATGCQHVTGLDVDHGAVTVQLMPYDDTPNNGGEYKAWMTEVNAFKAGCVALGEANGLDVVDCGQVGGNRHGFVSADSKTDNFKVGDQVPVEIDTRFAGDDGQFIDGLAATWTDTHGAKNKKWSYYAPQLQVNHEAHVEAVERGVHQITIEDQPGCDVQTVKVAGKLQPTEGPQTVSVQIKNTGKPLTVFVDVHCH